MLRTDGWNCLRSFHTSDLLSDFSGDTVSPIQLNTYFLVPFKKRCAKLVGHWVTLCRSINRTTNRSFERALMTTGTTHRQIHRPLCHCRLSPRLGPLLSRNPVSCRPAEAQPWWRGSTACGWPSCATASPRRSRPGEAAAQTGGRCRGRWWGEAEWDLR